MAGRSATAHAQRPLIPIDADQLTGKIVATLPKPDADGVSGRFIYLVQLETGSGSAPAQLDQGTAVSQMLVFRRLGKKVAAEIENTTFLAGSNASPDERRAIRKSFPTSTIWQGEVIATRPDGSFTVDLASFVARDALHIAETFKGSGVGSYKLVGDLSAADPASVKQFPRNVEFAARLTFKADEPTLELGNITPDTSLTLIERHSLIALPEPGFQTRTDRYGFAIAVKTYDYSAPLGAPLLTELASRFRLEKVNPGPAPSPVRKPIIFYIDRGAPEPVRSALREGVSWWNEAFTKAGFIDAFRAEILPEGADPLDLRYNVVNWVSRATRGWSLGQPISDPRTGEILKGTVRLGSLRARQDMMIFQALVGARLTGTGDPNDPLTAALARLRQLGAHEVGHAIGLQHNFASSSQGRYSVMDYPAPRITLDNGALSLRDAYGAGLGEWDKFAIAWLYGARTDAEAAPILARARAAGLRFVADSDARTVNTAHPAGAIWDDGPDSLAELRRIGEVRRAALAQFGEGALPVGEAQADLRRAFVPIWLLNRYQIEAAAKSLGGVAFPYALVGEGGTAAPVAGPVQHAALEALLATLAPGELAVPTHLLPFLSGGFGGNYDRQDAIEIIPTAGGPVFDPLKATELGAAQTLNALLAPERLNRLEAQHSADGSIPSPAALFDMLIARAFAAPSSEVGWRIATTSALALARVQRNPALSPTITLQLSARLDRLADQLGHARGSDAAADWSHGLAKLLNDREALDQAIADPARLPAIPPGMPIGMDER